MARTRTRRTTRRGARRTGPLRPAQRGRIARLALASAVVLPTAAGCSSGPDYALKAEQLITDRTAALVGLGPLQPLCEQPRGDELGTAFPCRATTSDGRTVQLKAIIGVDGEVTVSATNVIVAADVERIEERAVQILDEQTDLPVRRDGFDCGQTSVIIDVAEEVLACTYTEPDTGVAHDATIDIADLNDLDTFSVDVDNDPRS